MQANLRPQPRKIYAVDVHLTILSACFGSKLPAEACRSAARLLRERSDRLPILNLAAQKIRFVYDPRKAERPQFVRADPPKRLSAHYSYLLQWLHRTDSAIAFNFVMSKGVMPDPERGHRSPLDRLSSYDHWVMRA